MDQTAWKEIVTTRIGFQFICDSRYSVERHVATYGEWESHLSPVFNYFIKPGAICVDVGANSGYHTLGMAVRAGSEGKVFAFEPSASHVARLLENVRINPQLAGRIQVHPFGLGESEQELRVFHVGTEGNAYVAAEVQTHLADPANAPPPEECLIKPLDKVLDEQRIDVMKIDVEGMELSVLKGAAQLIRSHRPIIVYETLLDCFDHSNLLRVEAWFAQLQYGLALSEPHTGRLIPTRYPRYHEDTIAYPLERTLDFADFFLAAARYDVTEPDGTPAGALVLCSSGNGAIHARIRTTEINCDDVGQCQGPPDKREYVLSRSPDTSLSFHNPEQDRGVLRGPGRVEYVLTKAAGRFDQCLLWA